MMNNEVDWDTAKEDSQEIIERKWEEIDKLGPKQYLKYEGKFKKFFVNNNNTIIFHDYNG